MNKALLQSEPDQPAVVVLRTATAELHRRLHAHPLVVELLTRSSLDGYRALLEAFLRFYGPVEPGLVGSSQRLGIIEQYPRPMRTEWLSADLQSLGCGPQRLRELSNDPPMSVELTSVAALAGSLYVIKGSALGGRVILKQLTRRMPLDSCCRFFRGEAGNATHDWSAFQQFCNQVCRTDDARQAAVQTAKRTFNALAACLTLSTSK